MDNLNEFFEQLFESRGIKDEDDLSPAEREEYYKMLEIQQKSVISLEDFKFHIKNMKIQVELELTRTDLPKEYDIHLRARLKCYLLMEAFLDKPERARMMLEQYSNAKRR